MKNFDRKLFQNVEEIKGALDLDDKAFLDLTAITPRRYERIRNGESHYSVRNIELLCSSIDLSVDLLFEGGIDYAALARAYSGDKRALPERYSVPKQKLARVRSIKGMIEFVGMIKGYNRALRVAKRLQVQNLVNYSPEDFVSPLITRDFLAALRTDGFSEQDIRAMGNATLAVLRQTKLGRAFATHKSGKSIYEAMHTEYIDQFDHIWHYKLTKLNDRGCTVRITPRKEGLDAFKTGAFGNREICVFRQGVYASMLGNIESRFANVLESECMYMGGDHCTYHLSW